MVYFSLRSLKQRGPAQVLLDQRTHARLRGRAGLWRQIRPLTDSSRYPNPAERPQHAKIPAWYCEIQRRWKLKFSLKLSDFQMSTIK